MKNKWMLLALLCAIFVMYTVDRALLGLLAVPIQTDLGLSDVQFGFVSAAIFWTFSICVPFSGLAGDRFDRRKLIGFAAIAWSVMAVLAGFACGFWSLFILASVALVAPQTMYGPSANALLAECHTETRTVALSCHQAAYYTGWFVSGAAVAGILALFGSWRAAFFTFGTVGLVLGLAFLFWSRKFLQSSGPKVTHSDNQTFRQSLQAFFGCRTAVLVAVCYVVLAFIGFGYASWGPKFVAQKFGLTPSAAGTGVMLSYNAAAFVAILITGFVTDRFVKRFPRFRLALSSGAVLLQIPAMVTFALASSLPLVWTSAAFLGAMIGVVGANQFTMIFDVVPSQFRAGSIGFLNVIAGLVGSTAPIALGALSESLGIRGFELGFASMATVQLVAALALVLAMAFTFRRDFDSMEQR